MGRSIFCYTDSRILGGAERAMLMLAEGLDRSRWEVTVVTEDAAGTEAIAAPAEALGLPVLKQKPLPLGLSGVAGVPGFARFLAARRPAVFHAHMSSPISCKFALAAAVAARVPAVVGSVQVFGDLDLDRSNRVQLRLLAAAVDRYVAVSEAIASELAGIGWPRDKIEVVHNAVDLGRFEEASPANLGAPRDGRPLAVTVARLHQQKGLATLVDAAARIDSVEFAIVGEGPERARLESQIERLGVAGRVRLLGERSDVPALLAACDLFVLPSLYEGSSLALLEAMAAGAAIVATDIGGNRELIEDGTTGLLVPPEDDAALSSAIERLAVEPALRRELGERARDEARSRFGAERMAAQVATIYEGALSS